MLLYTITFKVLLRRKKTVCNFTRHRGDLFRAEGRFAKISQRVFISHYNFIMYKKCPISLSAQPSKYEAVFRKFCHSSNEVRPLVFHTRRHEFWPHPVIFVTFHILYFVYERKIESKLTIFLLYIMIFYFIIMIFF